jgi:hypothetical protein
MENSLHQWLKNEAEFNREYLIRGKAMQEEIKRLVAEKFGRPIFYIELSDDLLSFVKVAWPNKRSK